ncbi:neurofilament medium polypeptide-like [Brassica napus]|uniref:neurofilament medium polypeptide-like n=1 Tax=Brassica napus TaxID=3708 RepID=UPI00207A7974|nr:neurofilament medium polypeptide-like [Brassica napus]
MGATILVEGILMASNPVTSIPEERLLRARNFNEFCKYPWGNLDFDYLRKEVERDDEIQFPLCLHWKETKSLFIEEVNRFDQMEKVDVKCILGDPELHSDLVEDVDYWLNGSVDIAVAEAEVDENNYVLGIDANDQEKIEFLTKKVVSLEEKVKYLEGLLNIRGETVKETEKSKETEAATKTKVNEQNADYELDEAEVLQNYIDAKRQEIAKPQEEEKQEVDVDDGDKESENSETNEGQTQEEEEQQQEDETEVNADVDVGAKESENPKTNEGMKKCVTPPREVQQQVEDDAKVDVGAKEIENPETNEDGEVNEDASKKPVKGTKKRGRGTKGMKKCVTPPREVQQQVEMMQKWTSDGEVNEDASKKSVKGTNKRGRGTKGMKKDATPSREVQQQVEDDAEVDDGEVNEDASKKPVKGTKKRGRGTKGMKKCVTPPREVQQQVKDDAKVDAKESENPKTNEDGEVNEDASKKHVKFTKKRGRVTKEPNVDTSKSKRQKKQEDSAADVIGRVLEYLKKAD